MWLSMKNSTSIQTSIFSLRCTSCHFLFNISSPVCLLKSTASNSFLLSSTFFPSAAESASYLAALLSCFGSFTTNPCSPALLPTRSPIHPHSYFTFSYGFMVIDCVGWKSCPALLLMIPVLWSSCSLHQPALLPAPGKPEICFWTTFSTSITHFSHHVDSFKDGKLWYHRSDELPIHEQMSYPSLISRLFFIYSVPLVHFLTQWSVPAPFFFISGKFFSICWNVKLTCCWSERVLVSSDLFLCSCFFFPNLYPVLSWPFRQKSYNVFLFPANLESLFHSFETQGFRRCCG